MNYLSVGDMAQRFQLRQHNVQLKTVMNRLSEEVVTGRAQDVGKKLGGDLTALASIDRSLDVIESHALVASEAEILTGSLQSVLSVIQDFSGEIGPLLLSAPTSSSSALVTTSTNDAKEKFGAIISALNTNIGGRYIFAGTATETPPLIEATEILDALRAAVEGAGTPFEAARSLENWFDAPAGAGGFIDLAYQGNDGALGPLRIAEDEVLTIAANAGDPTLRDVMKGFALAALVHDGLFAGDQTARTAVTNRAGELILQADGPLTIMRAEIGTREAAIGAAKVRNETQASSLQLARANLLAVDPFEAATALEAVQTQLETLYTLTARLSGLSLVDYIR